MKDSGQHIGILFQVPQGLQLTAHRNKRIKKELLPRDKVQPPIPMVIVAPGVLLPPGKSMEPGQELPPHDHMAASLSGEAAH